MNPTISNQVPAQTNYYKHRMEGIQYYKEDKDNNNLFGRQGDNHFETN